MYDILTAFTNMYVVFFCGVFDNWWVVCRFQTVFKQGQNGQRALVVSHSLRNVLSRRYKQKVVR